VTTIDDIDLGALLGGLSLDTSAIVQRVLQTAVGQMMRDGAFAAAGGATPEDMIAGAVSNWLTRTVQSGDGSLSAHSIETTSRDLEVDDLVERASELAAALGACDCWGDDPDCPFCHGGGTPGWMPPDRRLFAVYVYPAIRTLRAGRKRTGSRPITTPRKDT
jgi:hypothetical protein